MAQGELRSGRLRSRGPRPPENPATIRCFVALQPDDDARDRLDALARAHLASFPHARRMRRENLHLTLAFIGALEAAVARRVAGRLAEQAFDAFDWALDAVGVFDRARVLWAGSADQRLEALAANARQLLDAMGVRYDRKPFVAHVTLLRKLPRAVARSAPARIEPPILWRASPPILLQSTATSDGTRYTPLTAIADDT